jgi:hypothetical protein
VRADELYWRSAIAPDRIGQYVQSADLKQEGRVTDPGYRKQIRIGARDDIIGRDLHENPWVWVGATWISPSLDQGPFEEVEKSVRFG